MSVTIIGPDGTTWYTNTDGGLDGLSINDDDPLQIQAGGMTDVLVITGEHVNDHIQFVYGSNSWTSGTTSDVAECVLQGSDWDKSGPSGCPNAPAIMNSSPAFACRLSLS